MKDKEVSIDINGEPIPIEPCIVCGKRDFEMIDTLYPETRDKKRWVCGCMIHNGGCGRQVYSETEDDTIYRWNLGYIDEYSD